MNGKKMRNSIIFWICVLACCLFPAEPCLAPFVSCIYCGDVTGDFMASPRDFLAVLGEYGQLVSGSLFCLDGLFSRDGYVDLYDLMGWDWGVWLIEEGAAHLCFDICLTPCIDPFPLDAASASPIFIPQTTSATAPQAGGGTGFAGSLLIAAKRFDDDNQDFLSDRLYNLDENYNFVGGPWALLNDRMNGKLVRDHNDMFYQINIEEGLVRFSGLTSVIPRGQGFAIGREPRYGLPATVYVGFQDQGDKTWGRPVLDATFDSQGYVYVTPVVVAPGVSDPYEASVKLVLAPNDVPPYHVLEIYDDPPDPNQNQDCNNLREIEVDDSGNVYVINSGYTNNSDILWVYDNNGFRINKCELQSLGIYGPIELFCSGYDNSLLYISSSMSEPNATSTKIYGLARGDLTLARSITIHGMGHVTGITEDPLTGTLWVAGFTMPEYLIHLPLLLPQFYHSYLAQIPPDSDAVQAECLCTLDYASFDLALPMSIVWTGESSSGGPDGVVYVDANATGANNGTSWGDAYNYLQDALADPCLVSGDQIWVAEGIYKPDQGSSIVSGDKDATFQLLNDVAVYGGFPSGGDPNLNDRNPNSYKTILSGDLNGNDVGDLNDPSRNDNSYHVVTASGTWLTTILDGFTITGGNEPNNGGGGILIYNGRATISNCIISGNSAKFGGGIHCDSNGDTCCLSGVRLADCKIIGNIPDAIRMDQGPAEIFGTVQIDSTEWAGHDLMLYGDGTLLIDSNVKFDLDNSTIRCNISGPGNIIVDFGYELIIEGGAIINLGHETDPNQNGQILCSGLLLVRDSVHLSNANIQVTRASFEGDVDISNSIITAESGEPYGQFFIEDTVKITGNDIHADGDRYMDLDPSVFAGLIANNRIFVTITEGVGSTRGGLLELRGLDGLAIPPCGPNEFFCQVNNVPVFDVNSWTLEQLKLVDGAKVNLTNRFDFGNGGLSEVMYVKELILGTDSVLNTAFNQLYYENLEGDPNSVVNKPLLGFSLSNIAFDNENEFLTRVIHNNVIDSDPYYTRNHVERVTGLMPDPNGMMRMSNVTLEYVIEKPNSPPETLSVQYNARAKGLFAKASEDEIMIRFEYLFGTSDPNVQLVIYLTDVPELLDHNDPRRLDHYNEVGRLYPPPPGQYGSAGSDHFGVFERIVSTGDLNFIRGVRIEFELVGPHGTWILINNWDPVVTSCIYCGDVNGDLAVSPRDYLAILSVSGELSSGPNDLGISAYCLDFGFSRDGFLDTTDLMGFDWEDWLVTGGIEHLCFKLFLTSPDSNESSACMFETTSTAGPQTSGDTGFAGSLLIGGKMFDWVWDYINGVWKQDFLSDRLYDLDENYNLVGGPYFMANDRMNGKLVRDHNNLLFQMNIEEGLVQLSAEFTVIIPRGEGDSIGSEQRYGLPADVHIGFQDKKTKTWGRPFFDAAFDSNGDIYVTPVVVDPGIREPYTASAKLVLVPGQTPPYNVVKIYDDPPLPNSNQDCNNLQEIEVDGRGNVYVINSGYLNNSDILWVYNNNGDLINKRELQNLGIYGPIGLFCSSYDDSRLYVASSKTEPDAKSASLYVLSTADLTLVQQPITINKMGHITDITENPFTGTLWVAGYTMPVYIDVLPLTIEQFYYPYLAAVPYNFSGTVDAKLLNISDLALPLSIAWVGDMPETCDGADLDGMGDVSFGDLNILVSQWLQAGGIPSADITPKPAGDGIVNFLDLAVLADYWLQTCGP